jgi:hypothetical protein
MSSVNDLRNEPSPRAIARTAAVFLMITIVLGVVAGGYISGKLVVPHDPAATAANITANSRLVLVGFTLFLVEMAANIALTVLFYQLLKPVHRNVALLSAAFGLVACTIKTMARLFYIMPLLVLSAPANAPGFSGEQLNALAVLLLNVNNRGAAVALPFFGFSTVLQGWLIVRSTFLPRWLGVLTILSGAGWLAFLWQPLGYRLFTFIALFALVGCAAMILWLLVRGVDEPRWLEQARASAASVWR